MTDKTQPTAHAEITAPISADLRRIEQSAARAADRDTHFYLAGWNGARGNEDSHEHFRRALQAAPPAPAAVAVPDEQAAFEDWLSIQPHRGATDRQAKAFRDGYRAALAAAPAQAQDDRAAFKAYLQECDDCEIVPDVAGAFHAAWQKRAAPAQAVAPYSREEWIAQAAQVYLDDGDDLKTANDLARWHWNQQDWMSGEIDDPREVAREDLAGREKPTAPAQAVAVPADAVAAALIRLDAIYRAEADDGEFKPRPDWLVTALRFAAIPAQEHATQLAGQGPTAPVARPFETAPKDGTIVRLLVEFVDHPPGQSNVFNGAGPLEDTAGPCWTIGGNSFENTGINTWQFVGWNWSQDCFVDTSTDAGHRVLGWAPFATESAPPATAAPAPAQEDARDALTLDELDQLDRAIEHFGESEDTDVDWRLLTRAASLGYLECERFTVPPTARAAIDAARAAQGGAA